MGLEWQGYHKGSVEHGCWYFWLLGSQKRKKRKEKGIIRDMKLNLRGQREAIDFVIIKVLYILFLAIQEEKILEDFILNPQYCMMTSIFAILSWN